MKTCPACYTKLGDSFTLCPICGMEQEAGNPAAAFYPKTRRRAGFHFWRRLAIVLLCLSTFAACIVNVSVGGAPWALYVVLGAYAAYVVLLSLETAEISLIRRIISGSYAISILLWGIEYITKSGAWATGLVIPLVLFAGLVASVALYFSAFRRYAGQFLPMLVLSIGALIAAFLGIRGILPMGWPLIALSGFAFAAPVAAAITFRRTLRAELRKKLHR